jgi:hypothetical protein
MIFTPCKDECAVRCLSPIVARRSDENSNPPRHLAVRAPRRRRLRRHALPRDSEQVAWPAIPRNVQASANRGQHPAHLHIRQAMVSQEKAVSLTLGAHVDHGSRRRHWRQNETSDAPGPRRALVADIAGRRELGTLRPLTFVRSQPSFWCAYSALHRINRRLTIEHPGDIGCGLGLQLPQCFNRVEGSMRREDDVVPADERRILR